jgi:hypothetical protein
MNTIYQLAVSYGDILVGFATNDEELRWLALGNNFGLEVRAEVDWETETVTVTPLDDITEVITYHIYKVNRATQEDA